MEGKRVSSHRASKINQREKEIKSIQDAAKTIIHKNAIFYSKLKECVQKFYTSILIESAKQIRLIKQNVESSIKSISIESAKQIRLIKQNVESSIKSISSITILINQECMAKTLAPTTIWKVKALSKKSESSFPKEVELFGSFLDILNSELFPENTLANPERPQVVPMQIPQIFSQQGFANQVSASLTPFPIKTYSNTFVSQISTGSNSEWGTLNKQKMYKVLPPWIQQQIEQGIKYNAKEIIIYQNTKPVSIADLNTMQYFYSSPDGKKSGPGMPLIRR
ncbi:hypothetical protein SteCoe_19737 [Stentor coeruleus]|uniref:Uncharacterized protein n=1 Tax=Stentor coeruleus TaxID=5963 RepID=A0A1R2BTE3_9CILI|nr:hypothetical protein SteCoe_19737 [Stentor coeruleus]